MGTYTSSIRFMTVPYHGNQWELDPSTYETSLLISGHLFGRFLGSSPSRWNQVTKLLSFDVTRVRCMTAYGWTRRREQQQKAIHRFQASQARFHRCTCKTCRQIRVVRAFLAVWMARSIRQLDKVWGKSTKQPTLCARECGRKKWPQDHLAHHSLEKSRPGSGSMIVTSKISQNHTT